MYVGSEIQQIQGSFITLDIVALVVTYNTTSYRFILIQPQKLVISIYMA